MRTLIISIASLALAACASHDVAKQPLDGGCVAMRAHFPIKYHGAIDAPDDIVRIRAANAAFAAACP